MKLMMIIASIVLAIYCSRKQDVVLCDKIVMLDPFVRLHDTVFIKIKIDSTFKPIGQTIFIADTHYYYSFSNGKDSVYIRGFLPIGQPENIDTTRLRSSIEDKYVLLNGYKTKNIEIKSSLFEITSYYELISPSNEYLHFSLYNTKDRIDLNIIYQTDTVDEYKLLKFKTICNSLSYKIHLKQQ